jgi:hypothetical protein
VHKFSVTVLTHYHQQKFTTMKHFVLCFRRLDFQNGFHWAKIKVVVGGKKWGPAVSNKIKKSILSLVYISMLRIV